MSSLNLLFKRDHIRKSVRNVDISLWFIYWDSWHFDNHRKINNQQQIWQQITKTLSQLFVFLKIFLTNTRSSPHCRPWIVFMILLLEVLEGTKVRLLLTDLFLCCSSELLPCLARLHFLNLLPELPTGGCCVWSFRKGVSILKLPRNLVEGLRGLHILMNFCRKSYHPPSID